MEQLIYLLVLQIKKSIETMKKISLVAAVLLLMALGVSSCKSSQDCPAYSKANTEQPTERA
ncbi:hypothetical protein DMA11_10875 [Marinilabiliaceae bacterium JC017]|nr:hypothetical protein DMA11_10875 [Marinilabiliaceae bacterium JC017]